MSLLIAAAAAAVVVVLVVLGTRMESWCEPASESVVMFVLAWIMPPRLPLPGGYSATSTVPSWEDTHE